MARRSGPLIPFSWDHQKLLMACVAAERRLGGDSRFGDSDLLSIAADLRGAVERQLEGLVRDETDLLESLSEDVDASLSSTHATLSRVALESTERLREPGVSAEAIRATTGSIRELVSHAQKALYPAMEEYAAKEQLRAAMLPIVARRIQQGRGDPREEDAVAGVLFGS